LIRGELGDEIAERMVGPLIGGINAGDPDRLSAELCAPQLLAASHHEGGLLAGCRRVVEARRPGAPVFVTHRHGTEAIVSLLHAQLSARGVRFRTGHPVDAIEMAGGTRRGGVTIRSHDGAGTFDGAIVATPAHLAGPMLASVTDEAAILDEIAMVGVGLVALALDPAGVHDPPSGSGFLVPPTEGRLLTACSWASSKWPHLGEVDPILVRCSVGRRDDLAWADLDDDALVDAISRELGDLVGLDRPLIASRVTRWHAGFPQLEPGHTRRLTPLLDHLAEMTPIRLAGAHLEGVGIPTCIRTARSSARSLLASFG